MHHLKVRGTTTEAIQTLHKAPSPGVVNRGLIHQVDSNYFGCHQKAGTTQDLGGQGWKRRLHIVERPPKMVML